MGEAGHLVEIDEIAWIKRKYNKGRQVNSQWVFGCTDGETKDCFSRWW